MPWGGTFDYDIKKREVEEEESVTVQPDFWNDPKEAEKFLKAIRNKKVWTTSFENVNTALEDVETMQEFRDMGEVDDQEVETEFQKALEVKFPQTISSEEISSKNNKQVVILKIHLDPNYSLNG